MGEVSLRTGKIYLGIFIGYLFIISPFKRYRRLFIEVTINVMTPYLILISILRISSTINWVLPIVAILFVTFVGILVPHLISKLAKQMETPSPAEICTSTFPNALNFPFPVIFALSPEGLGPAGIFLALSIVSRNTVGFWIAGATFNKEHIRQIIAFPPIWGIIVAILLKFFTPGELGGVLVFPIVDYVFELGIFMTLMTIGFSLQKPQWKYREALFRVGFTRYVVCGIFAFTIIAAIKPVAYIGIPFVVQLIAPPAVYNGLYAEKLNLDTELTTQMIVTLTIVALILLPLELLVLNSIFF